MNPTTPWWDERLAYEGDRSQRIRDYRRLQSRWREVELKLPPGSYTDRSGRIRLLGSRLPATAGLEHQLLSSEAVTYAQSRLEEIKREGGKAEAARLGLNLLSSQPLCFSVFGHLDSHRDAGARVLNNVLPWPVHAIETVLVEHAPRAAAIRLGNGRPDKTAFDAMLVLESDSRSLLVGVETKYTEPFSRRQYEKDSYTMLTEGLGSWFHPGTAAIASAPVTNQLWRNLLLAQESTWDGDYDGCVVVLSAATDRGATRAVEALRSRLKDPDARLAHVLLEDLMDAAAAEPSLRSWAGRFQWRYLALELASPPQTDV